MGIVNDTPEDEPYEIEGGLMRGSSGGTMLPHSYDLEPFAGGGPWTITFRRDPNLSVTVNKADQTAMLYIGGYSGGFAVKILQPNS